MRHVLLAALLALVAAGCKDFSLSSSSGRLLVVQVNPAVAREGVQVRVTVAGTTSSDLQVSLLGQLLSKDDSGAFVYLVSGHEPEGVDLAVEASAGSSTGSGKLRFDFTPPALLSVASSPGSAPAGQQVQLTLTVSEALATPPDLEIQGRAAPCKADEIEPQIYYCAFLPESADVPGYQVGAATLTDLAGNTQTLAKVGLGLVLDFGQALSLVDGEVTPAVAGRGATLAITFSTSRQLQAPPTATVAQLPAQLVSGPDPAGRWLFHYLVTGDELGLAPSQGLVDVGAVADGVSLTLPQVTLDFRAPRLVSATPDRTVVGLPALQTNVVTIAVEADEDLSALSASVQGRSADCQQATDAQNWTCTYAADGTETEGPQRVAFLLVDLVGNQSLVTSDVLFSLEFHCQLDPTKLFVLFRFGDDWKFVADPGACPPGASLAARPIGTEHTTLTATCAADGSVPETGDLGSSLPNVEVQVTDPGGNVSAWVPTRLRFSADTAHVPIGGRTKAWSWKGGVARPSLAEFSEGGGMSADDLSNLASTDTPIVEVTTPQVNPVDWVSVPPSAASIVPVLSIDTPLSYIPGAGAVHYENGEEADTEYTGLFIWDGASWNFIYPSDASPTPDVSADYGLAVDPVHAQMLMVTEDDSVDDDPVPATWLCQLSSPPVFTEITDTTLPPLREDPSFTFDRGRGQALLFGGWLPDGGEDGALYYSDTWIFDRVWTQLGPANAPSARAYAAIAYDAGRGRSVLFGGVWQNAPAACGPSSCSGGFCCGCDTWEWTGNDWIHRPVQGPSARSGAGMAWNGVRGSSILFGGMAADSTLLDDAWELDAQEWKPLTTSHSPPPLSDFGMTYDERRGRVVVFGGYTSGAITSDVWELTEDGLFPGVVARLDTADFGSAPSALTLVVVGSGISSRHVANGLVVSLWDFTTSNWTTVATAAPQSSLSTVVATISGSDVPRYIPGQSLIVLVTGPASSVDGDSTLRVDAINALLDW